MDNGKLYSVKYRVIGIFLICLLPLTLGLLFYTSTIMKNTERAIFETGKASFASNMERLEDEVDAIDIYLSDIVLKCEEVQGLNMKKSDTETYLLGYNVRQRFIAPIEANRELLAMMVYSDVNQYMVSKYNAENTSSVIYTLPMQKQLEQKMIEICQKEDARIESWFYLNVEGRMLYCRIKNYGKVYCIGIMDMQFVMDNMEHNLSNGSLCPFYNYDGTMLMDNQFIHDNELLLPESDESYLISGKNRQYMGMIENTTHFSAGCFVPFDMSVFWGASSQVLILACTLLVLLAVPMLFWCLQKYMFNPMKQLQSIMNRIASGEVIEDSESGFKSIEFSQVNETFQNMLQEISNLKIEGYEKELNRKRIEFQYLQLQIRPHFLFNCLKNMYGMAQNQKVEEMKQSILLLANHLRYIFTSEKDMVTLHKELRQCENYIELMKYSQQITCDLHMNIAAGVEEVAIPPISILTLVENSVKYAVNEERYLCLNISIQKIRTEEKTYLKIEITDSGKGFREKELELLNKRQEIIDDNERKHVGIYNVVQRCMFNYGEEFFVTFANAGGAKINMIIPMLESKGGKA